MILRNPSAWRDSLFMTCSLFLYLFSYPISSQGVIGVVKENVSKQPIGAAIVSVMKGDSVIASLTTDNVGRYNYVSTKAGRIRMAIHALGYKPQTSDDIFFDGYSTYRLENFLKINAYDLESVTITTTRPVNPYIQLISSEDLVITAANFDDPVRVAQSKPGIVLLNDQANHLSARGESPVFNSWYLEGLEIVNPNHTNNAGTFSDLPTQSGGGVNMFSAQTLGSTDIYTGLNPLSIGRSTGAVIDMHLHESAKPEFRAKAGFLGFEFGGGKAIGENGILDLNLRYSFTGLLANLGVDFGGEKIGFYDGVVSFRHQGPKHNLKIFGWAGRSENEFVGVEDPEKRERYKDFFDIDYSNDLLGGGIKFEYVFNPKLSFRTGGSLSSSEAVYSRKGQFGPSPIFIDFFDDMIILSTMAELSINHSPSIHSNVGLNYTEKDFTFTISPLREETFIRPYLSTEVEISQTLKIELGGEVNHSFENHKSIPGYRAVLQWGNNGNILYGGLRHAAGQALTDPSDPVLTDPLIIDKYDLGWNGMMKGHSLGLDLYFQKINHLTLYAGLIHLADFFDPVLQTNLVSDNNGIAQYYGIEGEWKFRSKNGWSWDINQALYKSERGIKGEELEPGRFDGRFTTHLSIAKEIIHEKKGKNRIWNFSVRGFLHGGLREPTIDKDLSESFESTAYVNPGIFNQQLPSYKRVDASISRTIANPKVRWRYSLDIQNVIGFTNVAYHYYDPFLESVTTQDQLGIIPVFSVQASW